MRKVLVFLAIAALILPCFVGIGEVFSLKAAQKLSDTGGIDEREDTGIHNSYGWCAEMFTQTSGDYLWVGTNRDLGAAILFGSGIEQSTQQQFSKMLGVPLASADNVGKIYRYKMDAYQPKWELMWEGDPMINGYRKMVVFNGDLYVFAGTTTYPPQGGLDLLTYGLQCIQQRYSAVYRFGPNFKPGDTPEVVLWENLGFAMGATPAFLGTLAWKIQQGLEISQSEIDLVYNAATAGGYYRAATVYNDRLYVGTFEGKIFHTDGKDITALTPNTGDKATGWQNFSLPGGGGIWDIIGFEAHLYAFVGFENDSKGFNVYKIDLTDFTCEQIVGEDEGAKYPDGLGLAKHVAASPFIYDGYVYVSTFANGPKFLQQMAKGNITEAFETLYQPATIYRFDKNDNWEVIVGDKDLAVKTNGQPVPFAPGAGMRAGFFPGEEGTVNASANQYIWWMAEHQGKLYASTWDQGVFRKHLPTILAAMLIEALRDIDFGEIDTDEIIAQIVPPLMEIMGGAMTLFGEVIALFSGDEDTSELLGDIMQVFVTFISNARETSISDFYDVIDTLFYDMRQVLAESDLETQSIVEALDAIRYAVDEELMPIMNDIIQQDFAPLASVIAAAMASALFLGDNSNPPGFDLFVSSDGVTFQPYTVTGLGDPTNYGGRVILPTKHGLFLTTANPFTGFQVWRLDDVAPALIKNPGNVKSIDIKEGDTVTLELRGVGVDVTELSVSADNDCIQGTVSLKEQLKSITNSAFKVEKVDGKYIETITETNVSNAIYKVTLTAVGEYSGFVTITINGSNGLSYKLATLDVTISGEEDDGGGGRTGLGAGAIAGIVIGSTAGAALLGTGIFLFVRRRYI